jgi:hypothetical protein
MKKQFSNQLKELYKIVGETNLLTREEQMLDYSHDEFPFAEISIYETIKNMSFGMMEV